MFDISNACGGPIMVIPWHMIGRPAGNLCLALVGLGCASILGIPDLLIGLGTLPIPEVQLPLVALAAVWVLNQIAKTILDAKKSWNEINKAGFAGELDACKKREVDQAARIAKLDAELATTYVVNAQKDKQISHHIDEKKTLLEVQAMLTMQLADLSRQVSHNNTRMVEHQIVTAQSVHQVEVVNPPSEPIPVTPAVGQFSEGPKDAP